MHQIYILDANVLLHDPNSIFSFADHSVMIPIDVLEQVDRFKKDYAELGRNARQVSRTLNNIKGKLTEGVDLENGGSLQVLMERPAIRGGIDDFSVDLNAREHIMLAYGLGLQQQYQKSEVIIVTKDINLRVKANALNLNSTNYEKDRFDEALSYDGYQDLLITEEESSDFKKLGSLTLDHEHFRYNEFVILKDRETGKVLHLGKIAQHARNVVIPLEHANEDLVGLTPLNIEQTFVLEALLDDKIKLVSLSGKAGTGKTLLAVAAGLRKVLRDYSHNKVLVARPIIPMGKDLGYLPGTIEEKMKPWMQPIYDSVEFLRSLDRRSRKPILPRNLLEMEELQIEPLTYIRGRSIPHQYMIIDEAQNLTPLEAKTIISRVGKNSKIILTGDPQQIDSPYMDEYSNGLSYVVGRMRDSKLSSHIRLNKGERSEIAEEAATFL